MGLHNDVGALGEQLIAVHLTQIAPVQPSRVADMNFYGVQIEIKTSRATLYNGQTRGYQFLLEKCGHTNLRNVDVLILICLDDNLDPVATYILPPAFVLLMVREDRKKITIPLNLSSPLHIYRDRWTVIADTYERR